MHRRFETRFTALRRLALFCASAVTLAATANAQGSVSTSGSVRVAGAVTDSLKTPIPRANVTLSDPAGRAASVRTDASGRFSLLVPGRGRYTLLVRAVGRQSETRTIDVQDVALIDIRVAMRAVRVLPPVQVVGEVAKRNALHPEASDLAGSVSELSGAQISREQVAFAQELLRKVPGVYRAEFNQGVVAGDIGIRGFNAESEIGSTKLLIDGIPSNMNSGVTEMNALFPLEISRIDVVRGTNDPRYGQFNLAGNIGVETPHGGSYMSSRLQAGSFGASEGQLLTAFQQGAFSQTLFAGLRQSDGFRDNARMDKWSVSGKWFYRPASERVSVGVIGRSHRLFTAAPGYLTLAESRATPSRSPAFSNNDGGTISTDHGSLHIDVRQTSTFNWSLRAYSQRFERIRFVRFTAAGAQQERLEDERQKGALANLTWRPAALASSNTVVTGGFELQQQDNIQLRFRTTERVRQATLRDYVFSLDNTGGFVQVSSTVADRLQLTGGVRMDRFAGNFLNRATNATLPIIPYGWIPQPKVSAALRITDRLSTYGNYGRAFQIGSGIATYSTKTLKPSRNDGLEFGVITAPTAAVSFRAGVWRQSASDEVRLKFDNSGDSENIGRTRRTGLDVESTVRVARTVSLWASATSQRAVLVEPGLTNPTARGKLLNHVPNWTAKYGADWAPRVGLNLSFWSYAQGKYDLTQANDRGRFGDISTVNADVSWRWRAVGLGLGATNLFSRYSEYVFWDGAQTLHSPAAPRSIFVTMTIDR
jgi:iron complex outermembrane recepter protein